MHQCDICHGSGWRVEIYGPDTWDFRNVRCSCVDFLAISRLSEADQKLTIDDLKDRSDDTGRELWALRFLGKEMLADPYGWLTLYGNTGSAKSLLQKALVASLCREGLEARYYTMPELHFAVMPGKDEESPFGKMDVGSLCDMLKRIPVLAIDELDKVRWSPWIVETIGDVLDYRHNHAAERVTLLSMNLHPDKWSLVNDAKIGHLYSRMIDGRFNRVWTHEKVPGCLSHKLDDGYLVPGFFETTLPDVRQVLRRNENSLLTKGKSGAKLG